MGKLEGKVAVITGGSDGMALASAKRFVEEGAYVFITGRKQETLDKAVKLIGRNVTGVRGDAANLDDLDRLFETVKREKNKIDVLFASAGIGEPVLLGEITEQHFDKTFDLNVRGTLFTVQKALPLFNDGGSIFMTGSNAAAKGFPGFGVYAASKLALRSFARTWLNELKERKIRVNLLVPGAIATTMQEAVLTQEAKAYFESLIPRGKDGATGGSRSRRAISCFERFELRERAGVVCRRRNDGDLTWSGPAKRERVPGPDLACRFLQESKSAIPNECRIAKSLVEARTLKRVLAYFSNWRHRARRPIHQIGA